MADSKTDFMALGSTWHISNLQKLQEIYFWRKSFLGWIYAKAI